MLTRLPKELQLDIIDLLGYQDAIRLSQANKRFSDIVDPQSWPISEKGKLVYNAQSWDKHNLTQKEQFKPKRHSKPTIVTTRDRDEFPGGGYSSRWDTCFCVTCGMNKDAYKPGGVIKVVTREVYHLRTGEWEKDLHGRLRVACSTCRAFMEYRELETDIWCEDQRSQATPNTSALTDGQLLPKGRIERLPAELQLQVLGDLDYQSAIRLSQTNRYFHAVAKQEVSVGAKVDFVIIAQYWEKHSVDTVSWTLEGNFWTEDINRDFRTVTVGYGCFTCFRVRPMEAFAARQILRCNKCGPRTRAMRHNLRCCIDCQIQERRFRHGLGIKLLHKLSTLQRESSKGVIEVRIVESQQMRYCDECKMLHTEEVFEESGCGEVKPSQKAIKRDGYSRSHRVHEPEVLEVEEDTIGMFGAAGFEDEVGG
ncbi:hypothetical protein LTR36_010670 [Oleoguttula mirabilis]|uniref:F-box domain-containing protein n=1 Tax=Oleoguttula mirabilis TaxID=1507867 RepID=A0AAV9JRU6_9PEZI|nr:hypothetical protein LTR36_010670 [Oleoguttula mirabilis]